jgi:peptidoglycan/LPS O-acetylase OafA/YrhL
MVEGSRSRDRRGSRMSLAMSRPPGLLALTGIRGVAAWFVVLYHMRLSLAPNIPEGATAILARGYLAVDLFFMLSGFVLWLNYGNRIRTGGIRHIPGFLTRRIARIWPLHAFMLCVAIAFSLLLLAMGKDVGASWSELPLHFLLIHGWGFTSELAWNDPSWSISVEFAAYLLFACLPLIVDWEKLSAEALSLLLIALAILLHHLMASGGAVSLNDHIPTLGIIRALVEFTMGTILCGLWHHWRNGSRAAILIAVSLFACFLILKGSSMPETAVAPGILAALLLLVAVTSERRFNPLSAGSIHYLGLISYSTYLVHFLLFAFFKIAFVDEAYDVALPLACLYLLITAAASAVLFHGLEQPAQRALNIFFDKWLYRISGITPDRGREAYNQAAGES